MAGEIAYAPGAPWRPPASASASARPSRGTGAARERGGRGSATNVSVSQRGSSGDDVMIDKATIRLLSLSLAGAVTNNPKRRKLDEMDDGARLEWVAAEYGPVRLRYNTYFLAYFLS